MTEKGVMRRLIERKKINKGRKEGIKKIGALMKVF